MLGDSFLLRIPPLPAKSLPRDTRGGGAGGESERQTIVQDAILRTVAFFDVLEYAPTQSELFVWIEWHAVSGFETSVPPEAGELMSALEELVSARRLEAGMGRFALPGRLTFLLATTFERTFFQPRKLRRARRVAAWLARIPWVRFVALANTTSLGHARNGADLDFFVVVRAGSIWSSRMISGGPYRVLGKLARPGAAPDAVCLSYYIADDALDLSSHMLPSDDPYYRYWFLALLPLVDDGVGRELWEANRALRKLHPRAPMWRVEGGVGERGRGRAGKIAPPRPRAPAYRLESFARAVQMRWFPKAIRARMNLDSSVIVSDRALKFHTDDARVAFRSAYGDRLSSLGLTDHVHMPEPVRSL